MIKRIFHWFLGLVLLSFGIALVAMTPLGTTAVTSLAFVVSEIFSVSFGTMTTIQNLIFFIVQIMILRSQFPLRQYLQIPVSFLLGFFIDLWGMLFNLMFSQTTYFTAWILFLIGCLAIALGTVYQLKGKIVYNPTEGIVQAISQVLDQPFGRIKWIMDLSLALSAGILSVIVLGRLVGVREGTLVSALLIGKLIEWMQRWEQSKEKKDENRFMYSDI